MALPLGLSYRRALIDTELECLTPRFGGFVVEVGAKRVPRGRWRAPRDRVRRWLRVNIDPVERPDVIADICGLPLKSGTADWIVCIEVLQYVKSPDGAMREIARVLGSRGAVVVAVPFLHRADGPTDRHRFTETRVRELLEGVGLEVDALAAQGRLFATVANQLRQAAAQIDSRTLRWLTAAGLVPVSALLLGIDGLPSVRRSSFLASFTTGYVAVGRKRSPA